MSIPMNNFDKGGFPPGNQQPFGTGPGYPPGPIINQPGNYHQTDYSQQHGYQPGYPPPPQSGGFHPQPGGYVPPGYQPVPQNTMGYHPGAPGGPPVVTQPGNDGWMNIPSGIPNCPRGLEYLTTIDQLLVKQKVELLEAFTGFETNNKYTIKNSLGQKVYWAIEENDCCTRNCCGSARPFDMKILDTYKNEVIHLNRPLACDSCCFPCCLQNMEVSAPPGNVIGRIEQEWSICYPQFKIKNEHDDTVLRIEGPFCTFSICGDVEFKVLSLTGEQVGKISKQWSGFGRELFTDADFFGISFPLDLDVRVKATLLGACFLIDMMFFEKSGNQERDRPGMF